MLRVLAALWLATSFACGTGQAQARVSFMPENNLGYEDNLWEGEEYGISENTFNKVTSTIYSIYKPIISKLGGNLVINTEWRDSTVNAYADREDGNWNISFFGGLARRKEMTEGGFALVVCHELAHHIGAVPIYSGDTWASIEGQSDQVGMQACLKKYFAGIKEEVKTLSTYAVNKCKGVYSGQDLRECYHKMSAAKSCADLLASLNGESIRFETPSKVVVSRTRESHPPAQCRLDTYVVGTLCKKTWDDAVLPDWSNESKYNCERPKCWYAS
jgi:hypothetical protein